MPVHQDRFTEETTHSNQHRVNEFASLNSSVSDDVVISHPGGGREAIEMEEPLLVALARANRSVIGRDDGHVDAVFDEALCDVAELALNEAGFTGVGREWELHKLRALMLQIARDLDYYADLKEYISQYSPDQTVRFGLQKKYEKSTYRKTAKRVEKAGCDEELLDATFIAVWALFWNGVPIPGCVKENYGLSYSVEPTAANFSAKPRNVGYYSLVDDLLEIVTEQLTLHYENDGKRTMRAVVGAFAHAAYADESLEGYQETAHHLFSLDSAITGSAIGKQIDKLDLHQVDAMFDKINRDLLNYVLESGVVSEPLTMSYDLTDVHSLGVNTFGDRFVTSDGRWRFAALSFTDPEIEFASGLRLLKSKSQRSSALRNLLRNVTERVDVGLFMADRGFDGRDDIEACRAFVPDRWLICAQDYQASRGRDADIAPIREQIHPGGAEVNPNAGYSNLHPPVQLIGYSGARKDDEEIKPIRAFYTDIPVPAEEEEQKELIRDLNFAYNQRAKIENMFKLVKNRLSIPSDTDKPVKKAFYFNMSLIFYNLYKIVNLVPSPRNGIEIDTTQKELLAVTRNLAFNGPAHPDVLNYVREES